MGAIDLRPTHQKSKRSDIVNYNKWKGFLFEAAKNGNDLKNIKYDGDGKPPTWMFNLVDSFGIEDVAKMFGVPMPPNWTKTEFASRGLMKAPNQSGYRQVQNPTPEQAEQIEAAKQKLKSIRLSVINMIAKRNPPKSIIIIRDKGRNFFEISFGVVVNLGNKKVVKPFKSAKGGNIFVGDKAVAGFPAGSIQVQRATSVDGDCRNAMIAKKTMSTTKGWGPFLYDVAMEYSTKYWGGLTSDRDNVSTAAYGLYNYYFKNRSGEGQEIQTQQMDINSYESNKYGQEQLTKDDESDDCGQLSAMKWASGPEYGAWERPQGAKNLKPDDIKKNKTKINWSAQPISKVFKKQDSIIDFLKANGLIHAPGRLKVDLRKSKSLRESKIKVKIR